MVVVAQQSTESVLFNITTTMKGFLLVIVYSLALIELVLPSPIAETKDIETVVVDAQVSEPEPSSTAVKSDPIEKPGRN
jgi:hypothetical protein